MIKDVVKVQTLDTSFETIERYLFEGIRIHFSSQIHSLDMIVVTRLPPEQIHSEQTAIQAQIELLLATVVTLHIDVLQVYGITQEHPSPS